MPTDFSTAPDMPTITINPGEYHATKEPCVISTLLGSCIATCLYDPIARVAGMNHFLLANRRYAKEMPVSVTEAGRYGINAMEILINEMIHLGAERKRLRAKAFGGGNVLTLVSSDNFFCVGSVNVRFIREFLKNEGIPLESEDLGGDRGRVIKFNTETYAVSRRMILRTTTYLVEKKERSYWKKSIEEHAEEERGSEHIIFKK